MPFLAFFSRNAYREVGRNWRGVNLAYLFLLMAVCCLPPALTMRKHMLHTLENSQANIVNQIPEIRISNGQVSVDQHQPCFITRKDGSPAIIIDTTGSMNYIDDPRVMALLTETSLIVRRGNDTFNTFDLSGIADFHFDKYIATSWLQTAKNTIAPLSYGIFLMLSYIFAVLVMLLAAIVGLILSMAMHGSLNFASALRIATVAATPSIIAITVSSAMGVGLPGAILAAAALAIYLVIGVKACAKAPEASEGHIDLKAYLHKGDQAEKAA